MNVSSAICQSPRPLSFCILT